jgi:hypothetical protein
MILKCNSRPATPINMLTGSTAMMEETILRARHSYYELTIGPRNREKDLGRV